MTTVGRVNSASRLEAVTAEIEHRAKAYARAVQASRAAGALRGDEAAHLVRLELFSGEVVDRFASVLPDSQAYSPMLLELYRAALDTKPDGVASWTALTAGMIAATFERLGSLRLSRAQIRALAGVFEQLGHRLRRTDLPLHAASCYEHAASLYLDLHSHDARDRCMVAESRARQAARPFSMEKVLGSISGLLTGYGYQPYRLLGWVVLELAAFSLTLSLAGVQPYAHALYLCLLNFLNPLGVGDTSTLPVTGRLVLVMESYAGLISTSVFFALLVRRWFRL